MSGVESNRVRLITSDSIQDAKLHLARRFGLSSDSIELTSVEFINLLPHGETLRRRGVSFEHLSDSVVEEVFGRVLCVIDEVTGRDKALKMFEDVASKALES